MFTRRITICRLFGIAINLDLSWVFLALLVATSLAVGWFPVAAAGFSRPVYWLMGVIGALGLFLSILTHEFCHALVGRHYQMRVSEISLFLFGGVAHLESEPPTPKAELRMALAGPAASLVLAAAFLGLHRAVTDATPLVKALFAYLYSINIVVAVFNMIPGFPLDGGRVLRSILWSYKGDIRWATKIASNLGQFVGFCIIALGIFSFFSGDLLAGVWSLFLGMLLISFARASYVQVIIHQALHGKPAASMMNPSPVVATPDMRISELMLGGIYGGDETLIPVVETSMSGEQDFVGCVDLKETRSLPPSEWREHSVADLMHACSADMQIEPDADAEAALTRMSKTGLRSLLVVQGNRFLGVLSQRALVRYLSLSEA